MGNVNDNEATKFSSTGQETFYPIMGTGTKQTGNLSDNEAGSFAHNGMKNIILS